MAIINKAKNKKCKNVKLKNRAVDEVIKKIAEKYGVVIFRDFVNCENNNAACAGKNIFLGKFDDCNIKLVAFFHELGHVLSNKLVCKRGYTLCSLSAEGLAWELGLGLAFQEGYKWDFYSKEMGYARDRLKTYALRLNKNI